MSLAQPNQQLDFLVNWGKLYRMETKKTEFITEIVLSLIIAFLVYTSGSSATMGIGSIAVIHSFNVARALEAYKKAKVNKSYQSKLE